MMRKNDMDDEFSLVIFLVFVSIFIFVGWLIPTPSPWEKPNTVYIPTTKQKNPDKVAPPMPKKEVLIDLNEDGEPEWYVIAPLNIQDNE